MESGETGLDQTTFDQSTYLAKRFSAKWYIRSIGIQPEGIRSTGFRPIDISSQAFFGQMVYSASRHSAKWHSGQTIFGQTTFSQITLPDWPIQGDRTVARMGRLATLAEKSLQNCFILCIKWAEVKTLNKLHVRNRCSLIHWKYFLIENQFCVFWVISSLIMFSYSIILIWIEY